MSDSAQAKEIFLRVVELLPHERLGALDELCPDAEARQEVEHLLEADSRVPPEFLAGEEVEASEVCSGERIGPYRILERIGEGGMGTVYAARQSFPDREVALKVLRAGHVSAASIRRFRYEIDVLGRLQHSGIARIYDAGSFDMSETLGAPREVHYFTMELVRGVPLLRHARENELGLRERLELLARTCDAVHYAHQRGVIHRDLKSDNVLVTAEESTTFEESREFRGRIIGQPKVLDFGIARMIEPDSERITRQTGEGALLGTLSAMSPEQVAGDARLVDVRTDLYALGVMLYELLCGCAPIALDGLAVPQAIQRILEEPPTPPERVDPELRGDLNTIALKALEKDPERRYQTAFDLAKDLRSFLRGEPIEARADSRLYLLRRSLRRHRWMLGASSATAILVGTLAMISLREARQKTALAASEAEARSQAEADYGHALEAVDLLTQVGTRGLVDIPQAESARRALLEASLAFHRKLLEAHPEKEDLLSRRAATRYAVANLLDALGERQEAIREVERSIDEFELQLVKEDEFVLETHIALASALALHGDMLSRDGDNERAQSLLERCVEIAASMLERVRTGAAERGRVLDRYAYVQQQLADCLQAQGRTEEAVALALDTFNRIESEAAMLDDPELESQLLILLQVATVNRLHAESGPDIEPELLRMIAGFETLLESNPASTAFKKALTSLYTNYSVALAREGRIDEASEQLELAIELGEQQLEAHPDMEASSQYLFNAYHNRGNQRGKSGDLAGAESDLERAATLLERLAASHQGVDRLIKLAFLENTRAGILIRLERFEEAFELLESSREHAEQVLEEVPGQVEMHVIVRYTLLNQGICSTRLGRHQEATERVDRIVLRNDGYLRTAEVSEVMWVWRNALELAAEDPALSEEERAELDESYHEGALTYLLSAEKNGFSQWTELRHTFEWGVLIEYPPLAEFIDGLAQGG